MTGYAQDFSMSNRAVAAYNSGEAPASKIGHGIPAAFIRENFSTSSWHHTSKMYNTTDFYNVEEVLGTLGFIESENYKKDEDLIEDLKEFKVKKAKAKKSENPKLKNVLVEYIEWIGAGRRKKPKDVKLEGTTVEYVSESTCRIFDKEGNKIGDKRFDTKGFRIYFSAKFEPVTPWNFERLAEA